MILADFSLWQGVDPSQGLNAIPILLSNLINDAIFVAGSLSVIFLIVGGFNYTISNGDPSRVAKAKSTITYAIVGLIISMLAIFIVTFSKGIFK